MWIRIIDVYWFSCWCRYLGNLDVGLYSMACSGMVRIMCMSSCIILSLCSLWWHMIRVDVIKSSLTTILAQRMAFIVEFWSGGWG